MSDAETQGRALAVRAGAAADLSPEETAAFGAWLLDVMSRLILVHDDTIIDVELRRLAREAFYARHLAASEQRALGEWVSRDLDRLRGRDRRTSGSQRRPGGARASDKEGYSPLRAAHLAVVDEFFGISQRLVAEGCEHGFKPATACTMPHCTARHALAAWQSLG